MGPGIPNRIPNDVAMLEECDLIVWRCLPLMFSVWPTNALIELAANSYQPETRWVIENGDIESNHFKEPIVLAVVTLSRLPCYYIALRGNSTSADAPNDTYMDVRRFHSGPHGDCYRISAIVLDN